MANFALDEVMTLKLEMQVDRKENLLSGKTYVHFSTDQLCSWQLNNASSR